MGFERFGTISFTSQTKTEKFVEFLEEGTVKGTRCRQCGTVFFPPRSDCCSCFSNDMEWFEVTGTGTLLTFTKAIYAPIGFEKDLPYTLAIVDFGDYKVFGRLSKDIPEDQIKVGMKVAPKVIELPEGHVSYEFIAV